MESFAEKLKEARKAAGLSQQKMADIMLIPKRSIENWETGERTPPPYVQRFVLNELEQLTGNHRAIIDRETWEAARAKRKAEKDDIVPPLEYKWENDELVINESAKEIWEAARDRYKEINEGKFSPPLGYKWENDKLVINESERELTLKAIAEYSKKGYISEETKRAIRAAYAARLDEQGK